MSHEDVLRVRSTASGDRGGERNGDDDVATSSLLTLATASRDGSGGAAAGETASGESPSGRDDETGNQDSHRTAKNAESQSEWFGQAMEYAAGVALRKKVLEPVMEEFKDAPTSIVADAPRFLGIYSRAELLFLQRSDGVVHQGSIDYVTNLDWRNVASWWEKDKCLSYTNEEWSQWWVQRCHVFDRGCAMVKLIDEAGDTLGLAYYERNIVDKHSFGDKGTITLIRGIRVAPPFNPEVRRRGTLKDSVQSNDPYYKGISNLLFCHILFSSVRYGSNGVGVNCPKNEVAEKFYESLMGPPVEFDQQTGRRYYRIDSEQRWKILQNSFRRQVGMWIDQRKDTGVDEAPSNKKEKSRKATKEGGRETKRQKKSSSGKAQTLRKSS